MNGFVNATAQNRRRAMLRTAMGPQIAEALSDPLVFEIMVNPDVALRLDRLEERFDGRPTLLILDEAWVFLDNPVFAAGIREWLKVLRRRNVSVVFATQSLADIADSSIAVIIVAGRGVLIALDWPGRLFFGQAGVALLLQAAFGFLVERRAFGLCGCGQSFMQAAYFAARQSEPTIAAAQTRKPLAPASAPALSNTSCA